MTIDITRASGPWLPVIVHVTVLPLPFGVTANDDRDRDGNGFSKVKIGRAHV